MAVERARIRLVPKSWGRADLRPWNSYHDTRTPIGEVWFERSTPNAAPLALLLKLIFTGESRANAMDSNVAIARGFSENGSDAWYILSAAADSRIAVGSKQLLSGEQSRVRILQGAILGRFHWQTARAADSMSVLPDMFQAIGTGLVIVEIQPTSDSTLRVLAPGGAAHRSIAPARRGPDSPFLRSAKISAQIDGGSDFALSEFRVRARAYHARARRRARIGRCGGNMAVRSGGRRPGRFDRPRTRECRICPER